MNIEALMEEIFGGPKMEFQDDYDTSVPQKLIDEVDSTTDNPIRVTAEEREQYENDPSSLSPRLQRVFAMRRRLTNLQIWHNRFFDFKEDLDPDLGFADMDEDQSERLSYILRHYFNVVNELSQDTLHLNLTIDLGGDDAYVQEMNRGLSD